jgi:hypothetical protein
VNLTPLRSEGSFTPLLVFFHPDHYIPRTVMIEGNGHGGFTDIDAIDEHFCPWW